MATAHNGERPLLTAATIEAAACRLQSLAGEIADPAERRRMIARGLGEIWRRERPFGLGQAADAEPKVFDAILFRGEWDLLEYRLDALAGVTAGTLVVEADRTFSGGPRTFGLTDAEIADRGWTGRVVADRVALPDGLADREVVEAFQRNHLAGLVARMAGPSDLILLCDIDEIPFAEAVRKAVPVRQALGMRQTLFFPNHERIAGSPRQHFGAALVPAPEFVGATPAEIREDACRPAAAGWEIRADIGIHLQYVATGGTLERHLEALGYADDEIGRLLRDRDRVRAGAALDGYACLVPDRGFPGDLATVDEARLEAALEYVLAQTDLRSGRRRAPVPDYLGPPPAAAGREPGESG